MVVNNGDPNGNNREVPVFLLSSSARRVDDIKMKHFFWSGNFFISALFLLSFFLILFVNKKKCGGSKMKPKRENPQLIFFSPYCLQFWIWSKIRGIGRKNVFFRPCPKLDRHCRIPITVKVKLFKTKKKIKNQYTIKNLIN